jgi:hypothetical protein
MYFTFFFFLWVIFALLDPDPGPATQINADTDPDPQPWSQKTRLSQTEQISIPIFSKLKTFIKRAKKTRRYMARTEDT